MKKYQELWKEENASVRERYELSAERIAMIAGEETVPEPYRDYFRTVAAFLTDTAGVLALSESGSLRKLGPERLRALNRRLYRDVLPDAYASGYADPDCAAVRLGEEYGPLLSYLYAEIRGQIPFAFECRLTEITILNELFIQIYNLFEEGLPGSACLRELLTGFACDYTELITENRLRELLDPGLTFAKEIALEEDLTDPVYLYYYGEYVSERELRIAEFFRGLPKETVERMADAYTEGYRKGFEVTNRSLTGKRTVQIVYELGFEPMVKKAAANFRAMGLEPVLYRCGVWSMDKSPGGRRGYHGTSPNRQYDYDHRYDHAVYYQKAYTDRKLAALASAYESMKELAAVYAGPAVIDTFGEAALEPVKKAAAWSLSKKQEKLSLAYASDSSRLSNRYIPGDRTSFTIIAFPTPAIGPDFEAIFEETVRINTLDYEHYRKIQQNIVDLLDQAEYVIVTGRDGNRTHMKVMLHELADPARQSNFENCVADVNIPVGEVFTSPVLAGTEGVLEAGSVCIGDVRFRNLHMEFRDGRVTGYSCDNFEDPEQGRELIKQTVLADHESLPIGEFAIGTNTAAYAMARRYGIADRLPILIAEKTGPHFAVGDTCYSRSEETAVFNPDGKELVARDNEISLLRKEDPSKAYFNCHTDITIPYDELGEIFGVTKDGRKMPVISGGKFVVPGTEFLNESL